jgi:excisionase family DNA binding protein
MQPERMLSPDQVARRLGVSDDTTYRLIRSGRLRARKVGRRYMVSEDALREFIERAELEGSRTLYRTSLALGRLYLEKAADEGLDAYFELAESRFRRAVSLKPNDPLPRYELVRTLILRGEDAEAKKEFAGMEKAQASSRDRVKKRLKTAV